MNLINIPVAVVTQPEDGPCLAQRFWAVHPTKGVAFGVDRDASGHESLRLLCVTNGLATERLLEDLGPGYQARQLPVVFRQHAEAVLAARRPKPVVVAPADPAPLPKPVRRLTVVAPARDLSVGERRRRKMLDLATA